MINQFDVMRRSIEDKLPEIRDRRTPEPDPDYLADPVNMDAPYSPSHTSDPRTCPTRPSEEESRDALISPKKLRNPCTESKERLNLHRELLMNQKQGRDVLKKSELQKTLDAREESRKKKEREEYQKAKRTSLELIMEQRANRYKQEEDSLKSIDEADDTQPECLKMYAKIRAAKGEKTTT